MAIGADEKTPGPGGKDTAWHIRIQARGGSLKRQRKLSSLHEPTPLCSCKQPYLNIAEYKKK